MIKQSIDKSNQAYSNKGWAPAQSCSPKLRIGLLIDSFVQPKWIEKVIRQIKRMSTAEIVVAIKAESQAEASKNIIRKFLAYRKYLIWFLYEKLDEFLFHPTPYALDGIDVLPLVNKIPSLSVELLSEGDLAYFQPHDSSEILSYNLDVIFDFLKDPIKSAASSLAKHGVWTYEFGDYIEYQSEPPHFWETMHNNPTVAVTLQIFTPHLDRGKIVQRSWSETDPISISRNRNSLCWSAVNLATKSLQGLYDDGAPCTFEERPSGKEPQPYLGRLYKTPTNFDMVRFLFKLAGRIVKRRLKYHLCIEQWGLAFDIIPSDQSPSMFHELKYIIPPKDRFWADPFPIAVNGNFFIFLEEFIYQKGKGHVAVIEMDARGLWKQPVKVLDQPYHLSYPFIFKFQDTFYMIPETSENQTIELYKCIEFPFRWELDRVLMREVSAVDTTLYNGNGLWWMFSNIKGEEESSNFNKLHLFFSDSPFGPWHAHKKNPVISDVRSARPAGCLFVQNASLYRPAQDCSGHYGRAISMNKISKLDPLDYHEEEEYRIEPKWRDDICGVHTYNRTDQLIVVDFLRIKSKLI